ncbi:MAG: cell division protein ZapA [Treponema sp.]|nr:cell division protein ZapA [Treponema sp.]
MSLPNSDFEYAPFDGPHDLVIDILGASFSITAGEDPAYLDEVLAQFRFAVANTQGISGMKDPLNVAILTGFLLCDEINKLKMQNREDQAKADETLDRVVQNLITRINQTLNENTGRC